MSVDEIKQEGERIINTEEVLLVEDNTNSNKKPLNRKRKKCVWIIIVAAMLLVIGSVVAMKLCDGKTGGVRVIPKMEITDSNHWNNYILFNAISISIPVTVEKVKLVDLDSLFMNQLTGKAYSTEDKEVIFRQITNSDAESEAMQPFCCIIVRYDESSNGGFLPRNETVRMDLLDKNSLDELVSNEVGPNARLMEPINYEWIRVNNANALMVTYKRTGNDFNASIPVSGKILVFQDDKRLVELILSYREKEADMWADDFEQVLRSFKWIDSYQ